MIKQPGKYQDFRTRRRVPATPASRRSFARRHPGPGDTDIGIIGVPFDGGVTNRTGARHGPRAVREQSTLLRRINAATGVTPFASAAGARPRRLLDRAAI